MPNYILAINQRRTALIRRKELLRSTYEQEVREIDEEIAKYDSSLAILNEAVKPYLCPLCNGHGSIRKPDAAGQMEDYECPACHGTGVKEDSEKGGIDCARSEYLCT